MRQLKRAATTAAALSLLSLQPQGVLSFPTTALAFHVTTTKIRLHHLTSSAGDDNASCGCDDADAGSTNTLADDNDVGIAPFGANALRKARLTNIHGNRVELGTKMGSWYLNRGLSAPPWMSLLLGVCT